MISNSDILCACASINGIQQRCGAINHTFVIWYNNSDNKIECEVESKGEIEYCSFELEKHDGVYCNTNIVFTPSNVTVGTFTNDNIAKLMGDIEKRMSRVVSQHFKYAG